MAARSATLVVVTASAPLSITISSTARRRAARVSTALACKGGFCAEGTDFVLLARFMKSETISFFLTVTRKRQRRAGKEPAAVCGATGEEMMRAIVSRAWAFAPGLALTFGVVTASMAAEIRLSPADGVEKLVE